MTCKEALDWCEQFIDNLVMVNVDTKKRTLGLQAMQACKSALEKQIPKKVRVKKISAESLAYICPCCTKKQISRIAGEWVAGQKNLYCPTCGQALDWGDGE